MRKIRKGDIVQVTKGKDRGKKAKVLRIFLEKERAIVEGINLVKKHKRPTRDDQKGGIVPIEASVSIANLMYFCKNCNRPVRLGFIIAKDGSKSRICKGCKETV
ncbi:MAG: 50S ribosomal protein L24 [Candidatus Omnitrophota bacterium]